MSSLALLTLTLFTLIKSDVITPLQPLMQQGNQRTSGQIEFDEETQTLQFTLIGNDPNLWFGIGYNGNVMQDTYSIIVEKDTVTERILGGSANRRGTLVTPTIKVCSNTIINNNRVVVVTRPLITGNTNIDKFNPLTQQSLDIISAYGNGCSDFNGCGMQFTHAINSVNYIAVRSDNVTIACSDPRTTTTTEPKTSTTKADTTTTTTTKADTTTTMGTTKADTTTTMGTTTTTTKADTTTSMGTTKADTTTTTKADTTTTTKAETSTTKADTTTTTKAADTTTTTKADTTTTTKGGDTTTTKAGDTTTTKGGDTTTTKAGDTTTTKAGDTTTKAGDTTTTKAATTTATEEGGSTTMGTTRVTGNGTTTPVITSPNSVSGFKIYVLMFCFTTFAALFM